MNKLFIIILSLMLFTNCKTTANISRSGLQSVSENLLGNFKDDYGISYTIDRQVWIQHPNIKYHLLSYDSKGQYFIARNDHNNPSEAGLYSRIDVMDFSNMEPWLWGFCLTEYKAKTPEEATNTQTANRTNPKKGCGGFPFSRMKKEVK